MLLIFFSDSVPSRLLLHSVDFSDLGPSGLLYAVDFSDSGPSGLLHAVEYF